MENPDVKLKGQTPNKAGKCQCERCKKVLTAINFYTYKDGSKCEFCKPCLTAHIDNFDASTYEWILQKLDVPYIPTEWNQLRDKAFAKDPYKMNGMSVIGKYLAKMKLKQYGNKYYADTESILAEMNAAKVQKEQREEQEKKQFQAELKVKLNEGKISEAEYKTLVSTETLHDELVPRQGDVIVGEFKAEPGSYEQAMRLAKNPFQQQNFLPQNAAYPGVDLSEDDKLYLAVKWGRLYTPYQWVSLQQLYKEFMESFDIQGAARIDTLKMICKTSLKMNQAIDCGDIDAYQKLSRVYDSMMKSAKFTEAQNKNKEGNSIDSASAIVDFVEKNSGVIPRYQSKESQDLIDTIIDDLKLYTKNLIYEDKSLAREIEDYLKNKQIAETMKKDRQQAIDQGLDAVEIKDIDIMSYKEAINEMREHDESLNDELIEQQYKNKSIKRGGG